MFQLNPIPVNRFVGLIVLALFIFVAHQLLNFIIEKWVKKEIKQNLLSFYVPATVNFIWIIFFLYVIYEMVLINPLISIFISGLVLFSTWSFVYDFVHGTFFKFQRGNLLGKTIKMKDLEGKVVKLGSSRINLQLENSEIIEYPYSKLSSEVILIRSQRENYINSTINISVPFKNEIEDLKQQLRIQLFNIPWIVSNKDIIIKIVNQDSIKIDFKINVYTLDEEFTPKIRHALESIKFE